MTVYLINVLNHSLHFLYVKFVVWSMWYMRKCADPWEMTTEVFKEKCDNTCRENSKGSPLSPTPTKSACV